MKKYLLIIESLETQELDSYKKLEYKEKNSTEDEPVFLNLNPKCEPKLQNKNLYQNIGGNSKNDEIKNAIQWILNFSDGFHSLIDIKNKSKIDYTVIEYTAKLLENAELIKKINKDCD